LREAAAGIESLKLGEADPLDRAISVGGAIEVGVVDQDGDAVAGDMNIALDDVGPIGQAPLEGQQGVFGRDARGAPVAQDEGGRALEIGMRHGP